MRKKKEGGKVAMQQSYFFFPYLHDVQFPKQEVTARRRERRKEGGLGKDSGGWAVEGRRVKLCLVMTSKAPSFTNPRWQMASPPPPSIPLFSLVFFFCTVLPPPIPGERFFLPPLSFFFSPFLSRIPNICVQALSPLLIPHPPLSFTFRGCN